MAENSEKREGYPDRKTAEAMLAEAEKIDPGPWGNHCRVAAYAASMILFSVYHIWAYAISDASYWIYVIQYLPVAFLLCRCYERCNSIWGSIGLHMLVNGMSMWALNALSNL